MPAGGTATGREKEAAGAGLALKSGIDPSGGGAAAVPFSGVPTLGRVPNFSRQL
jgi:hypothetical protein